MGQLLPYAFAGLKPAGFVSAEISTTEAVNLTLPDRAAGALVQATGGNIHWTNDAEAPPTSAVGSGTVLAADAEPTWFGAADLGVLKLVAAAAGTFLLVTFYGG